MDGRDDDVGDVVSVVEDLNGCLERLHVLDLDFGEEP